MEAEIFQLLSSGADAATICMGYIIWKLDRRVFKIETERTIENEKAKTTP